MPWRRSRPPLPLTVRLPIKPVHELYDEVLFNLGGPAEAIEKFETSLLRMPRRAYSLLGLAPATGDAEKAIEAYRELMVRVGRTHVVRRIPGSHALRGSKPGRVGAPRTAPTVPGAVAPCRRGTGEAGYGGRGAGLTHASARRSDVGPPIRPTREQRPSHGTRQRRESQATAACSLLRKPSGAFPSLGAQPPQRVRVKPVSAPEFGLDFVVEAGDAPLHEESIFLHRPAQRIRLDPGWRLAP